MNEKRKRLPRERLDEGAAVANAASTLYANIGFMGVDRPLRSVVVTSTVPNEGKSTIAVELARAMASSGKRTLLLECDLRRRSLARLLGVRPTAGWWAVVMGEAELSRAMTHTGEGNLFLLDAEPGLPSPTDLLDSKRFRALFDALSRSFAYVVVDTPPVGMFVDAAVVAAQADATVMVVREGFAKRKGVVRARGQLEQAGANVVGIVMSFCRENPS
ncbi:CpsD/CapB family tyrosine-protein kinase [Gordonibacter sp. 28C]|uniref:CpsD/CapB family tyrosine-protein kinase n=1 Tax=Gordonibacter sp. 28C TaxID=2078569 RepID=UPI001F5431A9|nr:CpsD/CapB family tyrosine-protein kinase [Gordonibacter sp. 28C]